MLYGTVVLKDIIGTVVLKDIIVARPFVWLQWQLKRRKYNGV